MGLTFLLHFVSRVNDVVYSFCGEHRRTPCLVIAGGGTVIALQQTCVVCAEEGLPSLFIPYFAGRRKKKNICRIEQASLPPRQGDKKKRQAHSRFSMLIIIADTISCVTGIVWL